MPFEFKMSNEDYDRISQDAEAYQREYKEAGFKSGVPICFLGDGTYIFRIYPDRDSKGFIRLFKRVWIHNGISLGEKKLRFWADERVNKLLEEAKEAGMEKLWGRPLYTFRVRENGYMMAHFYECPESEYMQPKNSYGAVVNRRQMFAIQDFIAELDPDDKRQMFDPNNPAPGIKLQVTRGAGKSNVSCGIAGMQKLTLPDLEFKQEDGTLIEYKGLDHLYITENDRLSDEDFFNLKNAVYSEISNFKAIGGAKDMSSEAHQFSQSVSTPSLQPSEAGKTVIASAPSPDTPADEVRCRLAEAGRANPKMAETYPHARFGNKPDNSTPYCMACNYEEECKAATAKKKAA